MLAAVHDRYGPPDVVRVINVPEPVMKEDEILVRVFSTTVTTADWRLRSSTFPRFAWLPGRLVLGLFRPRHRILGSEFSGMVAATGALVTRFTVGDPVVGFKALGGAHAEYVNIRQDGPVCRKPAELSDNAAVCLPFGGLTALVFLRILRS